MSGPGIAAALALAGALAFQPGPAPQSAPAGATPTPAPTPLYNFVYRATPAPDMTPFPGPNAPEIDEIDLNDSQLVPPSPLHVRVLTSEAVVSVAAATLGRTINIPQHQPGQFLFDGYIPDVPSFLRNRTFDVQFIASVSDGRSTSVTLPLTLR